MTCEVAAVTPPEPGMTIRAPIGDEKSGAPFAPIPPRTSTAGAAPSLKIAVLTPASLKRRPNAS